MAVRLMENKGGNVGFFPSKVVEFVRVIAGVLRDGRVRVTGSRTTHLTTTHACEVR